MKKNLLLVVALICSVCMFTACGDDDKEEDTRSLADKVAGVYAGELSVFIVDEDGDIPVGDPITKDVSIIKKGDTTIDMELKDLNVPITPGGEPLPLGTIKLENCQLSGTAENCTFSGAAELTIALVGKCDVSLTGKIVNGKLDMPISVVAKGMGGLQVKVDYVGTKK